MTAKINKTNAARLLDKAKIAYELVPYEVDENNLAATHVAEQLGEISPRYLKHWYCAEIKTACSFVLSPEMPKSI